MSNSHAKVLQSCGQCGLANNRAWPKTCEKKKGSIVYVMSKPGDGNVTEPGIEPATCWLKDWGGLRLRWRVACYLQRMFVFSRYKLVNTRSDTDLGNTTSAPRGGESYCVLDRHGRRGWSQEGRMLGRKRVALWLIHDIAITNILYCIYCNKGGSGGYNISRTGVGDERR